MAIVMANPTSKEQSLSNFSQAVQSRSRCFRPNNESELASILAIEAPHGFIARGQGLSYSDCCINDAGAVIETTRLNHLLSFDSATGVLTCQGNARFTDLFLAHTDYIPPVIPGTVHATVAGGLANDIHGKNNHVAGSLSQHIEWIELQIGNQLIECSISKNPELFYATVAGLGLTGIIKRLALTLRKASRHVLVQTEGYEEWSSLLQRMQNEGTEYDYQVAWLDLLNESKALLFLANHTALPTPPHPLPSVATMPYLPFRLINAWNMKQFNRLYFKFKNNHHSSILSLSQFNNPLDSIRHWTRVYGKKGLLQFQAVFSKDQALSALTQLFAIIQSARATPTLAVLKYFTQEGCGLLSFTQPGFTVAIDFLNNIQAQKAIQSMNEWITQWGGKVYLAKDLWLTPQQFTQQYPHHKLFRQQLNHYQSPHQSNLSRRLGLTP